MNPAFKKQLVICLVITLAFSAMNTLFRHWIFSSIGYGLCGLLWIVHPVKMNDVRPVKKQFLECRVAGGILILLGIMLRARFY